MERYFLLLLFLLILNLFDTIKRQYCKLLQHEGHFLFCRHSLWELLLWRVIPVCQKACFSPLHRPLLSPRLAQGEASGSIPTLIFIYIQRLGFGRLQKKNHKESYSYVFIYLPKYTIWKPERLRFITGRWTFFLIGGQIGEGRFDLCREYHFKRRSSFIWGSFFDDNVA